MYECFYELVFIWNLISIEKEHVINLGEFKAVPEISEP